MLLYRDDYYNQDEEDELGKSIVECNIAKNKDGETGVIEMLSDMKEAGGIETQV